MDSEGDPLTGRWSGRAGTDAPPPRERATRARAAARPVNACKRRSPTRVWPRAGKWKTWIRAGRLTVNGQPATLGMRVVAADKVRLDGRLVRQRVGSAIKVFLCTAPRACEDARAAQAALPSTAAQGRRRFVAVSPCRPSTAGLELVSSDGEAAERLQRGVRRLGADFSVRVHGELSAEGQWSGCCRACSTMARTRGRCKAARPAGGEGSNRWYTRASRWAPAARRSGSCLNARGRMVSRVLRTRLGTVTWIARWRAAVRASCWMRRPRRC